jgi:ribosomal protein L7/L12
MKITVYLTPEELNNLATNHLSEQMRIEPNSIHIAQINPEAQPIPGYYKQRALSELIPLEKLRKIIHLPRTKESETEEKIQWIKIIRALTGHSIPEAKKLVESVWNNELEQIEANL